VLVVLVVRLAAAVQLLELSAALVVLVGY